MTDTTERTVTIDEVVAAYIKLRNKKEAIERRVEEEVADIKAKMSKLEAWVKDFFDATGQTQAKTAHGTVFVKTSDFSGVDDWDAALRFIVENERWDMLEKRVSKTAVKAYIDEFKNIPPGVTFGTKTAVQFNKPRAKAGKGDDE